MRTFATMFAERGYSTLEVDIGLPTSKLSTSDDLLHRFEAGANVQAKCNGILTQDVLQS